MTVQYVNLGDVCSKGSSNIAQKDLDAHTGEYPIYGASGYIKNVDFYQQEDEYIGIVKDGAGVGRAMILPSKSSVIGTLQYIIPDKRKVNIRYLYYAIVNMELGRYFSGATIPHIYFKDYQREKFKLPDLETQENIANNLANIDSVILKKKAQINLIDELVKSRFVEMFGTFPENSKNWKICTIKEIVSDVRYGTSRAAVDGGKYPYLRMNNITYDGELDLTDLKYIDIPDKELEKCTVKYGDVLFNRTNSKELVGKTCVYNRNNTMVLAGFIIRVRVNDNILPAFLAMFLNMDFSKAMLKEMCKSAIGQANINATELQKIRIILPPIELQKEFVEFKNKTNKSKLEIQKSLDKLEILKKSLMQEYFS